MNDDELEQATRELNAAKDAYVIVDAGDRACNRLFYIDSPYRPWKEYVSLMVKASSRELLSIALGAVGALNPQDVEPDVVEGEGDAPIRFTATVMLATEV